jgi:hypothetical protein
MKLFALGAINRYAVLPTNALTVTSFSTRHALSYPFICNTLCIQTIPSLSESPARNVCDACGKSCERCFFYRCTSCNFDIDIKCSRLRTNTKEIQHFSHEKHPLMSVEEFENDEEIREIVCSGCDQSIYAPAYKCSLCNFFLHKSCAELSLRYNTLFIQITPLFSKNHQSLEFVMPAVRTAKDASPTSVLVAISTLTLSVLPVGKLNLTTVTNMISFPSYTRSTSPVKSVVRIATALPRYVAFVNSLLTLHVLEDLIN